MSTARSCVFAAAVGLLLVALASAAGEFDHKNVGKYTASNFKDKVGDGKVHFVKFFAPWCGHCKRMGPTWGELGDAFKSDPIINIASVDCTVDKGVCTDAGVKGFPTLKVYANGEAYKTHKGPRDLKSLTDYIKEAAAELSKETAK